jgi:hypothetical protein
MSQPELLLMVQRDQGDLQILHEVERGQLH